MYGLFKIGYTEYEYDRKDIIACSDDITKLIKHAKENELEKSSSNSWEIQPKDSLTLKINERVDEYGDTTEYSGLSIEPIVQL